MVLQLPNWFGAKQGVRPEKSTAPEGLLFSKRKHQAQLPLNKNHHSCFFFSTQKEKSKETRGYCVVKELVTKKFNLSTANVYLRRFCQTHRRQTSKCKKLTKANVQKEWPVWKSDSGSWSMEVELMTNNQPSKLSPHQRIFFPTPQTTPKMEVNNRPYPVMNFPKQAYLFFFSSLLDCATHTQKTNHGGIKRHRVTNFGLSNFREQKLIDKSRRGPKIFNETQLQTHSYLTPKPKIH